MKSDHLRDAEARHEPSSSDVESQPASRPGLWGLALALPLMGLWLLVAVPEFDIAWEHHAGHFWLVVSVAAVNVVLGARVSAIAKHHRDARLFLVSLAFLSSAGFLFLHALASPGVIVSGSTIAFTLATPTGLALAACFAAVSSFEWPPEKSSALMSRAGFLQVAVACALIAWGAVLLLGLPPLNAAPSAGAVLTGPLIILAPLGVVLYAVGGVRLYASHRRRPAAMTAPVVTSFALLAEAMVAVALGRSWHASWWEWHVLMALAFGCVAFSAWVQYRRTGSLRELLSGLVSETTVERIREQYGAATRALVSEVREEVEAGRFELRTTLGHELARRYDLTRGQAEILQGAAGSVARLVHEQTLATAARERMEHELEVAERIQRMFLPKTLPQLPGWRIDAFYEPARTVGGDFYDFVGLEDGRVAFVIGDVSGKGVPAALVMATTLALLKAEVPRLIMPGRVLERLNDFLVAETPPQVFVTCFYGLLSVGGDLLYANAGHSLPYVRTGRAVSELTARGMPLGLMPGSVYEEHVTALGPGATVVLHSDGLTEAHSGSAMFGSDRAVDLIRAGSDTHAIDSLLGGLRNFTGPSWVQEDDLTLVSIQREPLDPARVLELARWFSTV